MSSAVLWLYENDSVLQDPFPRLQKQQTHLTKMSDAVGLIQRIDVLSLLAFFVIFHLGFLTSRTGTLFSVLF